ncbi:hypothetical protein ILUMI_06816 [Ignelater luminosus]|uniref:Uncharacterized protein n=1 Tax=Ignelater luminosus TaxID=2038154 RepID=A0A8K0D9Y2_IGNLU|nr:hypothetical protein ILUMI_06816 [Ignelater luminosus]
MMGSKGPTGLHGPITSTGACFPGRYSPTYRSPEPMGRRCMPNPSIKSQDKNVQVCKTNLEEIKTNEDKNNILLDLKKYKNKIASRRVIDETFEYIGI